MNSRPIADPPEAQCVQELLAEEEFRYQGIDLPGGVWTAGIGHSNVRDLNVMAVYQEFLAEPFRRCFRFVDVPAERS
jgi:hypothetical protein